VTGTKIAGSGRVAGRVVAATGAVAGTRLFSLGSAFIVGALTHSPGSEREHPTQPNPTQPPLHCWLLNLPDVW